MQYKPFLLLYYLLSDPIILDHDIITQTTQVGFAQRQLLLQSSQERAPWYQPPSTGYKFCAVPQDQKAGGKGRDKNLPRSMTPQGVPPKGPMIITSTGQQKSRAPLQWLQPRKEENQGRARPGLVRRIKGATPPH